MNPFLPLYIEEITKPQEHQDRVGLVLSVETLIVNIFIFPLEFSNLGHISSLGSCFKLHPCFSLSKSCGDRGGRHRQICVG